MLARYSVSTLFGIQWKNNGLPNHKNISFILGPLQFIHNDGCACWFNEKRTLLVRYHIYCNELQSQDTCSCSISKIEYNQEMKALVYMFIMYIFILQQKVFKVDGFVSRRISLWNASCRVIFMVKFTSKKLPFTKNMHKLLTEIWGIKITSL